MKKNILVKVWQLLLIAFGVTFLNTSEAQITVTIGADNGTNGTTTYPCPLQDYYHSQRAQYLYTESELATQGITPGAIISAIGWHVDATENTEDNGNYNDAAILLEDYTIALKCTATSSLSTSTWETGATNFYGPEDYNYADFGDTGPSGNITFDGSFVYTGGNLIVELCDGVPDDEGGSYTINPNCHWTTGLSFNGSHSYKTDGEEGCGNSSTYEGGTATNRPQLVIEYTPGEDCTGTPVAGTATGPTSVCAGVPFTVSLTGATIAAGMTFQWYSSPAGADNFTAITGATSPSLSVASQTAATDYYCEFTCNNSSVSANSDPVSIGQNAPNQCYCTPSFAYQWMYITGVEFAGITNETDNWAANGYGDYTDQIANVTPTLPSQITVDVYADYYTSDLNVYIDWNQNGVLDDPGEVYNLATDQLITGDATFTLNIIPPVDAVPGNTRMRVLFPSYYADDGPCTEAEYDDGEAEDYTVNVATLDPCAGTPETGTLSGPASVCSEKPFTLSLSDFTIASGMVYEWQQSPAGTGAWADITGASGVIYNNPGITDATDYRVIFTCTASGESDTSNVLPITIKPVTECYCEPSFSSTNWEYISNVNIDAIDNTTGNSPTGYSDYSDQVGDIMVSVPTPLSITLSQDYNNMSLYVLADWNHNGVLGDPGEVSTIFINQYGYGENTFNVTLTPPLDAVLGNTRMRVLYAYVYNNNGGSSDPCPDDYMGDVEDYTLNVVPMPPCSGITFPDTVGTIAAPASLCVSGDVHLNIASLMPYASGITYQWQRATSETGTYTNIGTASATSAYTYNTNTTYWYHCLVKCDGTTILTSNPIEVEAVVPVAPTATDGQHCGPGTVTLSGTVGSGNIFWYDDINAVMPVYTGDTFITPYLNATATYYASAGANAPVDTVVGSGNTTSSYDAVSPFYHSYGGYKHQYLIKASELQAAGIQAGNINQIGFNVSSNSSNYSFNNFSISMGNTTNNALSSWETVSQVMAPVTVTPAQGVFWLTLDNPYPWDGFSNIVVQVCFSNEDYGGTSVNIKYSNTDFNAHAFYNEDDAPVDDICSNTSITSFQHERPNMYFQVAGCESERMAVTAYIRDTPVVDLGPDEDICGDANQSVTLDAGNPGSTYVWDDGSTNQTLTMNQSATHYVTVTNEYGCVSSDTTTKGILLAPEVHLGNDTTICNGVTITLNAGDDGIIYYWNTGDTVHTIDVNSTGTYSVIVTNDLDCTVSDTINVNVEGDLPTIDAVLVTNVGPYTFNFQAYNPQGAITGYTWDFGDDQAVSHEVSPTHTYQGAGNYQVTLTLNTATCGLLTFTTSTHIVGVNDISVDDAVLGLYPNPAKDMITIEIKGTSGWRNW